MMIPLNLVPSLGGPETSITDIDMLAVIHRPPIHVTPIAGVRGDPLAEFVSVARDHLREHWPKWEQGRIVLEEIERVGQLVSTPVANGWVRQVATISFEGGCYSWSVYMRLSDALRRGWILESGSFPPAYIATRNFIHNGPNQRVAWTRTDVGTK